MGFRPCLLSVFLNNTVMTQSLWFQKILTGLLLIFMESVFLPQTGWAYPLVFQKIPRCGLLPVFVMSSLPAGNRGIVILPLNRLFQVLLICSVSMWSQGFQAFCSKWSRTGTFGCELLSAKMERHCAVIMPRVFIMMKNMLRKDWRPWCGRYRWMLKGQSIGLPDTAHA